jgi:hypothetical protein
MVQAQNLKDLAEPEPPSSGAASHDGPQLGEQDLASLRRDGFLVVHGMTTPEEVVSLRSVYDRLFSERRGWERGDMFDMVGPDDLNTGLGLPQLLWPSRYEPALRQSRLAASARSVAEQILGPKIENMLEHAIMKPPLTGAPTPWHQDDAFIRKGSGFVESISIWMSLQDVTVESGCLLYIRGSNLGPLFPHRTPGNDPRVQGLETVDPPDLTHCVAVPVPAGSAVVHLSRTIHGAGANKSTQPRRAYVLGYGVKARPHQFLTRDYPWNLEKDTARDQRALRSLPPLRRTIHRLRRFVRGERF